MLFSVNFAGLQKCRQQLRRTREALEDYQSVLTVEPKNKEAMQKSQLLQSTLAAVANKVEQLNKPNA